MPVKVFVYPVSKNSLYVPLTFRGISNQYMPLLGEDGDIDRAIEHVKAHGLALLHIQWEELIFLRSLSVEDADSALERFRDRLLRFRSLGGRTVVTIHNEVPHTIKYREHFLAARQLAADASQVILVHSAHAADVVRAQIEVDPAKLSVLPHPSYLDCYEAEAVAVHGLGTPSDGTVLGFGAIREQKGFGELIDMLPVPFLEETGVHIKIAGTGHYAKTIMAGHHDRPDVAWDIRYVPHGEAMVMIRSALCVALVYKRFLTSGVAHLVISAGGLFVAPDVPQHRDLLPAVNHAFLFKAGDADDFRRAVRAVAALSAEERLRAKQANLEVARGLRPEIISKRLAAVYDTALSG